MIGALSNRYGVRGFEIGFSVLGVFYLLGALAVTASALFTFKRNKVNE